MIARVALGLGSLMLVRMLILLAPLARSDAAKEVYRENRTLAAARR